MLSIIIPTLNEEKYLPALLDCLKAQTFKDFEIIISDAGSTDKTLNIAKDFNIKVVPGGLPGVGRNNGALNASYQNLVFIDSDITFKENFLKDGMDQFIKSQAGMASGYFNNKFVANIFLKVNFFGWNIVQFFSQFTPFPLSSSQVLFVKKEVFNKLNGFNPAITISEDIDIIKRCARGKFKFKMLNTNFYPSTRRFKKNGFIKPILAGLIGAILVYTNRANGSKSQKGLERLYGGWGGYNL